MVSCDSLHLCFFFPALLLSANSFWVSIWVDLQIGILFFILKPYLTIVIFIQLRHTFTVSQTFPPSAKKNQLKQKRQKPFLQIFLLLFLLVSMIFDKTAKVANFGDF